MTRIAHLSDPHIDGSPERTRRLERVVDEVGALPDIDLVVVTGDIADHGAPAEYAQFIDTFTLPQPTVVVPGNHDLRATMSTYLTADASGHLNAVATADGLTVVGLDSLIEHETAGALGEDTLAFARDAIAAAPGAIVLAFHHPPVPVGHQLMDQHGLRNAAALAEIVAAHDSVIALLTGHVHTALATTFAGRPLLGAPGIVSTMRLGSRLDPIADQNAMPGLALHTVHPDRRLTTVFHYLSPDNG